MAFQVRDEIVPNGALLRTAGRGITMPEQGRTEAPYWVSNEAEARKAVQELAARKVDFVKIWVDDRDGKYKKLTPELYGAIIDEAHKNGLRVTAHIFTLEDAKGLLRAGLDAFAHSVRDRDIDEEGLAMFKQHANLVVAPNLPDRGVASDMSWLAESIPADELKKLQAAATDRPDAQKAYGIQARNLAKIHAAGIKIVLGTDGGIPWSHHVEMADMVAAGMTPSDVIVAATKNSAEFLRMNDAGTVAPGKRADFLVLDANPLDDITNTRKISAVYLRGAAVDRAAIRARMSGSVELAAELNGSRLSAGARFFRPKVGTGSRPNERLPDCQTNLEAADYWVLHVKFAASSVLPAAFIDGHFRIRAKWPRAIEHRGWTRDRCGQSDSARCRLRPSARARSPCRTCSGRLRRCSVPCPVP